MKTAFLLLLALAGGAAAARAQSLPFHRPLNPMAAGRSALAHQPFAVFSPGKSRLTATFEYGNAIEYDRLVTEPTTYLLDAEFMRASLAYRRELNPATFVTVRGEVRGAYAGFADDFFVWYHDLIGFSQPERAARPINAWGSQLALPNGVRVVREPAPFGLGDFEATIGFRHSLTQQTALTVTLPTATNAQFGRGTVAVAAVHTLRVPLISRVTFEGSLGAGLTPRHGALAEYQRTLFLSGSTGLRLRLWGGQSAYGFFYYHSPYYAGTTFRSLDRPELSGEFGWISRARDGSEWRVGFTEDIAPGDMAIDLVLKIGRSW
ncbi:MAG TPA: DUF3187 family protein [Gemmatimonadales bacterium]|nr:DUF3187 family protein [Gemmatimonadales bacterium]